MKVEITYNLTALEKSAQFIWDHNSQVRHWPDAPQDMFALMRHIKSDADRMVRENLEVLKQEAAGIEPCPAWINMMGTGGYTVCCSLEDQTDERILIGLDFLVDPDVDNKKSAFVNEVFDTDYEIK